MKKIYIAGKVSGESVAACTMKFGTAQKELESLGFEVVNPLQLVNNWKSTWHDAMKKCIIALIDCDAVVLLPDWEQSIGAKIECQLANGLGITTVNYSKYGLTVLVSNLNAN